MVVNTALVTSTITDPVPELWLVDLVPIQYSLAVSGAVVMFGVDPLYILVKAVKEEFSFTLRDPISVPLDDNVLLYVFAKHSPVVEENDNEKSPNFLDDAVIAVGSIAI